MKAAVVCSFIILFSFYISAQNTAFPSKKLKVDSIDIKQMVKAEIERIKNKERKPVEKIKQTAEAIKKSAENNKPVEINETIQIKNDSLKNFNENKQTKKVTAVNTVKTNNDESFAGSTYFKLLTLVIVAIAASVLIIVRRRRLKLRTDGNSNLKKKVTQLRDDKVDIKNDEKLNKLRQNLQSVAGNKKYDEESLSTHAKQLSVSKGELSLAARLKSFYRIKNARTNK